MEDADIRQRPWATRESEICDAPGKTEAGEFIYCELRKGHDGEHASVYLF